MVSTAIFFRDKPFAPTSALLSDLASPDSNPHGYLALALATFVTTILLVPAVKSFHVYLANSLTKIFASCVLSLGLTAMMLIALLSPFTHGYSPLHIQLAYTAFVGILFGTTLFLVVARGSRALISLQLALLLFLLFEYFDPQLLSGLHFFNSLAFCEWCLCFDCAVALWILAGILEPSQASN